MSLAVVHDNFPHISIYNNISTQTLTALPSGNNTSYLQDDAVVAAGYALEDGAAEETHPAKLIWYDWWEPQKVVSAEILAGDLHGPYMYCDGGLLSDAPADFKEFGDGTITYAIPPFPSVTDRLDFIVNNVNGGTLTYSVLADDVAPQRNSTHGAIYNINLGSFGYITVRNGPGGAMNMSEAAILRGIYKVLTTQLANPFVINGNT